MNKLLPEIEQALREGYVNAKSGKWEKARGLFCNGDNTARCIQGVCMRPYDVSVDGGCLMDLLRLNSFDLALENKRTPLSKQWFLVFDEAKEISLIKLNNDTDATLPELAELMRERVLELYGVDIAPEIEKDNKKLIQSTKTDSSSVVQHTSSVELARNS